ncbi:MAG: DUF2911 domain-containing protein [Chitinophagaceae bacterium]
MKGKIQLILLAPFLFACNNNTEPGAEKASNDSAKNVVTLTHSDSVDQGLIVVDTIKGSPFQTATATIGTLKIDIGYSSPGVKGRIIWGGLVPYDKVWVTGAHQATTIEFSKDVEIGGKKIKAGKYALFTIPGRDKWIAIINLYYDQHLADQYNEKADVVRVELKPGEHAMTQRLTYTIEKVNDQSGTINVQWEKIILQVPFTIL